MTFQRVPWQVGNGINADGSVPIMVAAHEVETTEDEEKRGAFAMVGEVTMAGRLVFEHRMLVSRAHPLYADPHVREATAAAFADRLRAVLAAAPEEGA